MKKVTVNIAYDEDKLSALKLYLEQKGAQLEAELTNALDTLYAKTVPAGVRTFIGMRSGVEESAPKARRPRLVKEPEAAAEVTENE